MLNFIIVILAIINLILGLASFNLGLKLLVKIFISNLGTVKDTKNVLIHLGILIITFILYFTTLSEVQLIIQLVNNIWLNLFIGTIVGICILYTIPIYDSLFTKKKWQIKI